MVTVGLAKDVEALNNMRLRLLGAGFIVARRESASSLRAHRGRPPFPVRIHREHLTFSKCCGLYMEALRALSEICAWVHRMPNRVAATSFPNLSEGLGKLPAASATPEREYSVSRGSILKSESSGPGQEEPMNRRETLKFIASATTLMSFGGSGGAFAQAPTGPFTLPPLGYAFDALEPHIDAQTM